MDNSNKVDLGGGRHVTFEVFEGEIAGDKTWSESHIHSSGGGGYIGPYGGNIRGPSISSSNSTHQEIWVRQANGQEFPLQLTNQNVMVRAGHKVALIVGANRLERRNMQLINLTSRQLFDIDNRSSFINGAVDIYPPAFGTWIFLSILFGAVPAFMAFIYGMAKFNESVAVSLGLMAWAGCVVLTFLLKKAQSSAYWSKFKKAQAKINEGLAKIHKTLG